MALADQTQDPASLELKIDSKKILLETIYVLDENLLKEFQKQKLVVTAK